MAIIDLVRWAPQGGQTVFAYRFPETNLSTYTQLIVQESQEAVLFSKGQIAGKFGPGRHTLNTENLPILRTLYGIPFGSKNPFTAEVWFVNKLQPFNIDWCIDKLDHHDVDYNTYLPIVAHGKYGMKLKDAEKFLLKIVGTKNSFDENDLTEQFSGEFATKTKSLLSQRLSGYKIGIKQIASYLDDISEHLRLAMLPFWENLGFELTKFYVTTIEIDRSTPENKRLADALSQQSAQHITGHTWQQSQAFDLAKGAVHGTTSNNGSGLLGAIIASNMMGSMGMGGGMIQPQHGQPTFTPQGSTGTPGPSISLPIKEVFCSNCSKKFGSNQRFCPSCGDEYCPCPKCGTDNDKSAKRCVSCGTHLLQESKACDNCNAPVALGAAFCGTCGKPQAEGNCTRCSAPMSPTLKFCPKCGQKKP